MDGMAKAMHLMIVFCAAAALSACLPRCAAAVPAMGEEPLLTAESVHDVTWMPDSRALAVNTDRALVLVEPHGPRILLEANGALSPDGNRILYADATGRLFLQDVRDGAVLDLGLAGAHPRWAPRGARFAYYSDGRCPAGAAAPYCPPAGLVAADLEAGELVPLNPGAGPDGNYDWLPGASGVVYFDNGELGIARADAATNTLLTRVAPFPCPPEAPCQAWVAVARRAPRAAAFLFNDRNKDGAWDSNDAAALVVFDTGTGQMLHTDPSAWFLSPGELSAGLRPRGITWSPDGSMLCYVARDAQGFFLMFLPFSGDMQPLVLRTRGRPDLPRWSPDAEALAYVLVRDDASSPAGAMSELRLVRFGNEPGSAADAPAAR
jgi:hypothetical protein